MIAKVGLIACLLFIVYQDLRYRAVYWIMFPLLLGLLVSQVVAELSLREMIETRILNLIFLFLQLLVLTGYFSLKNKAWTNITNGYLGWGDILFLGVSALYFSPVTYLVFYTCSLVIALLFTLIVRIGSAKEKTLIPLAGLQAFALALLLLANWNWPFVNLIHPDWSGNLII